MEFNFPSQPVTIPEFVSQLMSMLGQEGPPALIMRGAPGSGKSTVVAAIREAAAAAQPRKMIVGIASADTHRMVDGKYVFDPKKNDEAHAGCLRDFIHCATSGDRLGKDCDILICDNTNVSPVEIAPYWATARAYGWSPLIVQVLADPYVAAGRNLHGVPTNRVCQMAERISQLKLPGHYRQVTVHTKEST